MYFAAASIRSDCSEAEIVEEYISWLALNFNLTLYWRKWEKPSIQIILYKWEVNSKKQM